MKTHLRLRIQLTLAILILTISVLAFGQTAQTPTQPAVAPGVPRLVKFGGVLKDASGNLLTNTVGITFAIYSEQTGGAPLWQETQNVQFTQGRYTVFLGESTSAGIPAELFASGQPRWLGVRPQLPGEEEQPRVLLASVPYALKAVDADTLGGLPASAFIQANGSNPSSIVAALATSAGSSEPGIRPPSSTVTTSGGTVGTIPEFDSSTDIKNSPIKDSSGEIVMQNLENVRYADQFPGSDIGAKIANAYANCPSNGCVIRIAPGSYSFSTAVVFDGTHGPANLHCDASPQGTPITQSAVQLTFTGTGAAITFNDGGTGAAGMQGCTLFGPGKGTSTIGLVCGSGASQCDGHVFADSGVTRFGTGVQLGGSFSFLNTFLDDDIGDNGKALNLTGGGGNEGNKFIGGLLSNQSISPANCVDTSSATGPYDMEFIGVSLDQCNVMLTGTGQRFRFIGSHLEQNAAFASATPFISIGTNCGQCNLQLDGTDIQEDGNGAGRSSFIQNSNTSSAGPAAVIINGGRFYAGTETGTQFDVVYDVPGTNLTTVHDTYKAGLAAFDVTAGLSYGSLEFGVLNVGGTGAGLVQLNGKLLISAATPAIVSGFGSGAVVTGNSNGTAAFTVYVGTGGTAQDGTISLPAAPTGWNCTCTDISTYSSSVFQCRATPGTTTTVGLINLNASGSSSAWGSGDTLNVSCFAR
jgi:hypothetical protein